MHIIYCIDNKLGGVTSLNFNLAVNCTDKQTRQTVLHILCKEWDMAVADLDYPVDENIYFNYSATDNYYHSLKRLYKLIPGEEGVLVVNYEMEMAMLDHYPVKQTVYQLVHDNYNLKLAKKYGHVVDVFICHNSFIYAELKSHFTKRQDEIHFLPHGVQIPGFYRQRGDMKGPLQLLFLGRMSEEKGIYDLPVINGHLIERGIEVEWTCIGDGPELEKLRQNWQNSKNVKYYQPSTNQEVLELCAGADLFVLPTKFEGTPVALLESMSVGLVPVISDLEGGIRDIVTDDTGFRIPIGSIKAFADAIENMDKDRGLLETLSLNCRKRVIENYDVKTTALTYHGLFNSYKEFYKRKVLKKIPVGARLDQRFIPSFATKFVRTIFQKDK